MNVSNRKFALAIQWHPEMVLVKENAMFSIFKIYNSFGN